MLHRGKLVFTHPEVLESRPLVIDDLAILKERRGPHPTRLGSGHVEKLRSPHHRLARFIAAGFRGPELVERSGYSPGRIANLRGNPAFAELVAQFQAQIDSNFVDEITAYEEYGKNNMVMAQRMLAESLEEHDENGTRPSTRELMSIITDGGDRFGYPKLRANVNGDSKDFGNLIEKAIARSKSVRQIEVSANPPAAQPQSSAAQSGLPAITAPPIVSPFRRRA